MYTCFDVKINYLIFVIYLTLGQTWENSWEADTRSFRHFESQNTNNLDMRNNNSLCQFIKLHLFSTHRTSLVWVKLEVALPSSSHFFSTLGQLVTALSLYKKHRARYQYIDLI